MFLHLLIFRVNEGEVGALVGQVRAVDADIGQNAVVTYSIKDPESLFRVEKDTGRLFTRGKLDFETSNLVYVSVTARDGAKEAREVETNVTVLVQDVQDEVPYFPQAEYTAEVPENRVDYEVARVTAMDRDTLAVITYRIMEGDVTKFSVNPETGEVRTLQGLDYERTKEHVLIIGTEEAMVQGEQGEEEKREGMVTTRLLVTVTDENDLPPRFTVLPPGNTLQVNDYNDNDDDDDDGIQVRNDAPLGQVLTRVEATDDDSEAGVTFSLVTEESSERAGEYFSVSPGGQIILQVRTQELMLASSAC